MFQLKPPPVNVDANDFSFKRWFQDIYTWSKGGVLIPNGGAIPDQSGKIVALRQKNLLTNGSFQVFQRGTTISNGAGTVNYTADRWAISRATAGTVTVTQQAGTDLLGQITYARVARSAADTTTAEIFFVQNLETVDCWKYRGQYVTLSFWIRCGSGFAGTAFPADPAGNKLEAHVISGTGVDQGPFVALVGSTAVINKYLTPTTTWQFFQVTGQVPTNSNQLKIYFGWVPPAAAGANNYIEIAGVQLELGTKATAFEVIPFGVELEHCCRYYNKSFVYGTAPVQASASNAGVHAYPCTVAGAAVNYSPSIYFPVTMRGTPTITYYNPQAANAFVFNFTRGTSATATANAGTTGPRAFNLSCTGILGWAVGDLLGVHWTAEAEL